MQRKDNQIQKETEWQKYTDRDKGQRKRDTEKDRFIEKISKKLQKKR